MKLNATDSSRNFGEQKRLLLLLSIETWPNLLALALSHSPSFHHYFYHEPKRVITFAKQLFGRHSSWSFPQVSQRLHRAYQKNFCWMDDWTQVFRCCSLRLCTEISPQHCQTIKRALELLRLSGATIEALDLRQCLINIKLSSCITCK